MAIFDPEDKKFYCECGCGEQIPSWQEFCKGHWQRRPENRRRASEIHSRKIWDQESRARLSESLMNYFATKEGQAQARRSSEENTGRYLGVEHSRNVSKGIIRAHEEDPTYAERTAAGLLGLERSSETREKVSQAKLRFWASEEGLKLRKRFSEEFSREGNPNWRGGYDPFGWGWGAVRELILIRDDFTCKRCGKRGGWEMEVHHIDGNTFNISDSNLVTVCHSCNLRASRVDERDYWIEFYTNKVKESA